MTSRCRLPRSSAAALVLLALLVLAAGGCAGSSARVDTAAEPPPAAERNAVAATEASLVDEGEFGDEAFDDDFEDPFADPFDDPFAAEAVQQIADPLEPMNRLMFGINDTLYQYVLRPVKIGYRWAVPETARIGLGNFFHNLLMPVRAVNALLQLKVDIFGAEVMAFVVNTTAGFGGLMDLRDAVGLRVDAEDFGQTLGRYGVGHGVYLFVPFLGPSSLRDGTGVVVDWFGDPIRYTKLTFLEYLALTSGKSLNSLSLDKDTYEAIVADQIDPYLFIRNAYVQYRKAKVEQ